MPFVRLAELSELESDQGLRIESATRRRLP